MCRRALALLPALCLTGCLDFFESDSASSSPPQNSDPDGDPPQSPTPEIELQPATVAFGDINVGTSRTIVLTITNTGTAQLVIVGVTLDPGSDSDFTLTSAPANLVLDPGLGTTADVRCSATSLGAASGMLRIESNHLTSPQLTVPVSANRVTDPFPDIDVEPTSLAFGDVVLGGSRSLDVEVRNAGTVDLRLTRIALTAGSSPAFALSSSLPTGTVAPGGSASFQVIYTPEGLGPDTGTLAVESDDADEAVVTVSLSGSGVAAPAPEIDVTPLSLAFGDVVTGSSRSLAFTVRNTGTAPLAVSGGMGPGTTSEFSLSGGGGPASTTLDPGASLAVEVTYSPIDETTDSGTVEITSDDADEAVVVVSLAGTGVPGAPAPEDITFRWDAPTTNTDGSPLVDLAGYRIYDGPSPGSYTMVTDVGNVTEFTLTLDAGTYYVAVTAYDVSGNESGVSNEIEVVVGN